MTDIAVVHITENSWLNRLPEVAVFNQVQDMRRFETYGVPCWQRTHTEPSKGEE